MFLEHFKKKCYIFKSRYFRDETESKCTMAPKILDSTEDVEVCQYNLGPEECRDAKLYLPVQKCTERAEEKSHPHYHTT